MPDFENIRVFLRVHGRTLLVLFMALLVVHDIFGQHGFLAMRRTEKEIAKVKQDLQRLSEENRELAEQVKLIPPDAILPRGVIVGSAVIEKVSQVDDFYRWHLIDAERAKKLRKPRKHPQPAWFRPFD